MVAIFIKMVYSTITHLVDLLCIYSAKEQYNEQP